MRLERSTGPPTEEQVRFVEALYRRYRALMYKHARGYDREGDEVDDIVSASIERLFRHAETIMRLDERHQVSYILQTIHSVAGSLYRKRAAAERFASRLGADERLGPDPEAAYIAREGESILLRHLYETLDELSETDRLLLVGRYMRGESDEALARQLGVKAASIRTKLTRARCRARRILERKEAGGDG